MQKKSPDAQGGGTENRAEVSTHAKHRARMREKILDGMVSALASHELIETVLWVPIARRDTNVLGHALITRFGSVGGVMHASKRELVQVDGIGERTAEFLLDFGRAAEACERSRTREHESVTEPETAERIAKDYFAAHPEAGSAVLGLDGMSRLIGIRPMERSISIIDMISAVVRMDAKSVIFAFRDDERESGEREHTESECVSYISKGLGAVGAEFCDYIVVRGGEAESYRRRLNPAGRYVERSELEGQPILHFRHGVKAKDYGKRPRAGEPASEIMRMLAQDPKLAVDMMSREINRLYDEGSE